MLLKSGFSGLLTSSGIGTTEIGPTPQQPGQQQQQQQQSSVIGGSVSTFKAQPHPPASPQLSNGSPMRNNHQTIGSANQQHLSGGSATSSPLSSFKINHFQKNGASTLFAIANRNANGGGGGGNGTMLNNNNNSCMNNNNNNVNGGYPLPPPSHSSSSATSDSDCGGSLINPEVAKLKSGPQQMPFPVTNTASPQKNLNNHNIQSQVVHQQQQQQLHNQQAVAYLQQHPQHHNNSNNGLDIDQQQRPPYVSMGAAVKEDLPPIDCFAMTNHQRHDEIQLLNQIQDTLKEGWTVHLAENGRLYYCK